MEGFPSCTQCDAQSSFVCLCSPDNFLCETHFTHHCYYCVAQKMPITVYIESKYIKQKRRELVSLKAKISEFLINECLENLNKFIQKVFDKNLNLNELNRLGKSVDDDLTLKVKNLIAACFDEDQYAIYIEKEIKNIETLNELNEINYRNIELNIHYAEITNKYKSLEEDYKKISDEKMIGFTIQNSWICNCKKINFIQNEVCQGCYKLKPGVIGWVCVHCKAKNSNGNKCSICGSLKDGNLGSDQIYWKCENVIQ